MKNENKLKELLAMRDIVRRQLAQLGREIKDTRNLIAAPARLAALEKKEKQRLNGLRIENDRDMRKLEIFRMRISGCKAKEIAPRYGVSIAHACNESRWSERYAYRYWTGGLLASDDPIVKYFSSKYTETEDDE